MKLIDREDAIKAMCYVCGNGCTEEDMQNCPEHYALTHKPSAEPRKKGKWKGYNDGDPNWQRDDGSPIFLICSKCHETVINNGSAHWNFCPNCCADMRGEE